MEAEVKPSKAQYFTATCKRYGCDAEVMAMEVCKRYGVASINQMADAQLRAVIDELNHEHGQQTDSLIDSEGISPEELRNLALNCAAQAIAGLKDFEGHNEVEARAYLHYIAVYEDKFSDEFNKLKTNTMYNGYLPRNITLAHDAASAEAFSVARALFKGNDPWWPEPQLVGGQYFKTENKGGDETDSDDMF